MNVQHANLSTFEFFSDFSKDELRLLEELGKVETYQKGKVITDNNEEADFLFLLLEGRVDVILPYDGDNKQLNIFSAGPGDLIGWSSLLKPYIYTGQSQIKTDSILMKFEAEKLLPIFSGNNHIGFKFMQKISEMISRRLWHALLKITSGEKN